MDKIKGRNRGRIKKEYMGEADIIKMQSDISELKDQVKYLTSLKEESEGKMPMPPLRIDTTSSLILAGVGTIGLLLGVLMAAALNSKNTAST
jgi:hypothetical protein